MAEVYFRGNNHSSVSYDVQPHIFKNVYIQVGFALLYVVIFGLSFFGNMAVTLIVSCYWKTKSVYNFWLGNLAVANLAVSIFCIIQNLILHLLDKWIFGQLMCRMYHLITSLWQGASILIHVFISLERYIFLVHPIRHRQIFTRQKLWLMVLGVWLTSGMISLPSFWSFGLAPTQPNENGDFGDICVPIKSMFTSATADTIYFLLVYFVPVAIGMAMYVRVGLFVRESGKLGMEVDEPKPRAQNELLLASKLRPSPKDGTIILRSVQSAPGDLQLVSNSASSSRAFNFKGHILPQKKAGKNIRAGKAKGSRKLDGPHRYGLHIVPTIELTPPSDDIGPGGPTDRGVGRSDCVVMPALSREEMLSRGSLEARRRYHDEEIGESTRGSHSPTACTAFSSNLQKRRRTAKIPETQMTLYRVNRQRLSRIRCKQGRQPLCMLILTFLTFAVLNLPDYACELWLNFTSLNGARDDAKLVIAPFTFALMHANCAVNPIIYYAFMRKYFRASLNDFYGRYNV